MRRSQANSLRARSASQFMRSASFPRMNSWFTLASHDVVSGQYAGRGHPVARTEDTAESLGFRADRAKPGSSTWRGLETLHPRSTNTDLRAARSHCPAIGPGLQY